MLSWGLQGLVLVQGSSLRSWSSVLAFGPARGSYRGLSSGASFFWPGFLHSASAISSGMSPEGLGSVSTSAPDGS
ncbi:hypothetical protein LINPERPRIM_LOCUS20092 [Linum perenne]